MLASLLLGLALLLVAGCTEDFSQHSIAPNQSSFSMTVEEVFYIKSLDRVIVVGTITEGMVQTGDSLVVKCSSGDIAVVVEGIECPGEVIRKAEKGKQVGLKLSGIRKNQVTRGDKLIRISATATGHISYSDDSTESIFIRGETKIEENFAPPKTDRTGIEVYCKRPWSRIGSSVKCTITDVNSRVSTHHEIPYESPVFIPLIPSTVYMIRINRPIDFISFSATFTISPVAGHVQKLVYEPPLISFGAGTIVPRET